MNRLLAGFILVGATVRQILIANAKAQVVKSHPILLLASTSNNTSTLRLQHSRRRTILGGEIRSFDFVRDQGTLKLIGQRPVKILFDERTRASRDRSNIRLNDLGQADMFREPVKLLVPVTSNVIRVGQPARIAFR